MNFYGEITGPEHLLFGRVAPICEALHRAVYRAAGKPVQPVELSKAMPEWCHNIADRLGVTIFKRLVALAPQGKFDARSYGRMIGVLLRGITHFCKEVPADLKREGLLDLEPEKEKKVEAMIDMPAILSLVSKKFNRPILNETELVEVGTAELKKKVEGEGATLLAVCCFLLNRPVAEQYEFLCGIPEGFVLFLNNDGGYSGHRSRTPVYLLLLMYWPEIAEVQKAEPPKTSKLLLEWLDMQEGRQEMDEKQFSELCWEIGLVMTPPGHPHKSRSD